jgi:hypothetical protein
VREPLFVALFCLASGCHASVHGDASASANGANASAEADSELESEVQKERATTPSVASASAASSAAPAPDRPLLGARRDLSLVPAQVPGQCSCLRVALGPANLGAFRWKGPVPKVDDQRQLVVALSSEGAGCQNPKGSLGASYWGYRRVGNDIVVYVENAVAAHPLAQGAIIPKPLGNGQVYVAPVSAKLPFGKATNGKGNCSLGNPGLPRTAPLGPDETGAPNAPAPTDDFLSGQ